jgi:hypothetical protein
MNAFETWWYNEGSAPPKPGEDMEEHCKRMCQIAWENGAFCAGQPSPPCPYGNEPKTCTSSPMDCQCAIDATLIKTDCLAGVHMPWIGLTDEERRYLRKQNQQHDAFAKAIEALLRVKNL